MDLVSMTNFLLIIIKSFFPIAITSFVLVWWALRRDYLGGASSLGEYEQWKKAENQSRKAEKKRHKAEKKRDKAAKRSGLSKDPFVTADVKPNAEVSQPDKRKFDPLHSKWMEFGGGFYGVVALFTYGLVELGEIRDFLLNFSDIFSGGLISLIVQFFIESIKNFIIAIAWPAYWLRKIHGDQWLWIVSAYAGYWLGTRAAFHFGPNRVH